jgi:hypothetical protein
VYSGWCSEKSAYFTAFFALRKIKKAVRLLLSMAILPFDPYFSFLFCRFLGCFRGTPAYRMIPLAVNP